MVNITPTQLKTANLIFAEHEKLVHKVPQLESKISNLETVNSNWVQIDSLRSNQILLYQETLKTKEQDIKSLKKSNKVLKYTTGGSVLAIIILALVSAFK